MKKLLVVSAVAALGLSSAAFAGGLPETMPTAPAAGSVSDTGVYVGLAGGFGMTHWKNLDGLMNVSISNDNGFVGRVFLGYDLNRYFALEAGYSYFFNKPKGSINNAEVSKIKSTQDIDVMLKGKLPVVESFDLYSKFGVNYLMTNFDTNGYDNRKEFNVAYGFGADYAITSNIIANVEWLRFNGCAKLDDISKYQPNTDAFLVGLRYKFDL